MKTAHNVKLLNGSKQEVSYTGVETVTMPGTDGQDKVFTAGAPIDVLDISPDFSGGDMPLESPEGSVVRGATIKKPEGAEQVIAKGKTLAGITGEYVTTGTAKEIILDFSAGSETDYLPQLTGTTALDDTYGYFIRVGGGTPLTVGETYLVSWDGTAYTCIAQDASILMDGAVCLGNATALGLSGNDEPFCAAYLQEGFSVVALTDTAPTEHTVRIYQVSEDQTVTAEGDERWSSVTVKKPETLVPDNITEGVEIAGVVGTHEFRSTIPYHAVHIVEKMSSNYGSTAATLTTSLDVTTENDVDVLGSCIYGVNAALGSVSMGIGLRNGDVLTPTIKMENGITVYSYTRSVSVPQYYSNVIYGMVSLLFSHLTVQNINGKKTLLADSGYNGRPVISLYMFGNLGEYPPNFLSQFFEVADFSHANFSTVQNFIFGNGASYPTAVKFPGSIVEISANAFATQYGLSTIDFSLCSSVPSLGSSGVFDSLKTDYKIIVPDSLYSEWISADKWSKYESHIVKASEYEGL